MKKKSDIVFEIHGLYYITNNKVSTLCRVHTGVISSLTIFLVEKFDIFINRSCNWKGKQFSLR